jgi:diacylglycerol kinase (ATP)
MKILLVTNPGSGSSDDEVSAKIQEVLAREGEVNTVAPEPESFDREVLEAVRPADLVVVAGGDGTLHYAINALKDHLDDLVFGLVPMGTGNDFARTMGISDDPVEAAQSLLTASEKPIDVGHASGAGADKLFINACMGGFPVDVDRAVNDDLKKRIGPLAFWVAGAKALKDATRSTVVMNGIEVPDCVAAGVGNGRTCGGGIEVWPEANPSDGALDGCALPASSVASAARLAVDVKRGKHEVLEGVETVTAERIEISADPAFEFNVDGELPGLRSPATFQLYARTRFRAPAG